MEKCMLKKTLFVLALVFLPVSIVNAATDKYVFDKSHTHIFFLINHLGFSNTLGRIREYDGYFTFDEQNPEASAVDVTLTAESIDTDVPALDKELYGEKFFNVEKY